MVERLPVRLLELALDQYEDQLGGLPNVNGMGIRDDPEGSGLVVAVYVSRKLPEASLQAKQRIPKQLLVEWRGRQYRVPVSVVEQGEVRPERS